jgi:hypothetical protein
MRCAHPRALQCRLSSKNHGKARIILQGNGNNDSSTVGAVETGPILPVGTTAVSIRNGGIHPAS